MSLDFLSERVSKYTNHKIVSVSSNFTVTDAVNTMINSKIDSILVNENEKLIGIVTEKDIIRDVVAKGKHPSKTTIREITHGNLITIHKDSTVKEAIELMTKNNIRRLIVLSDTLPVGIISQKVVCGNLNELDLTLPELETPDYVKCPYCSSQMENKHTLSKHIDDIHIGRGLLQGNLKKA